MAQRWYDNSLSATSRSMSTPDNNTGRASKELRDMSTQWRDSIIEASRNERDSMTILGLLKRGYQALHLLLGFAFLVLAVVEFVRDPPYFDAIGKHSNSSYNVPGNTFYILTRDTTEGGIRRIMDLPLLFLFTCYFVVLLWRRGWGVWSAMMTFSMLVLLMSFLTVNYFADKIFDWRYFGTRGYGVLLQIFGIAFAWDCVAMAAMVKIQWYPFKLTDKRPVLYWALALLVLWNFVAILVLLFFCLLIWISHLYFSWACVSSLNEVLLMCQFTDRVQCYSCPEALECNHLETCVHNNTAAFTCQSPLALLPNNIDASLCIFNFNIGFFTFVRVFAYVGGIYFFLSKVINFAAKASNFITVKFMHYMRKKTHPHIQRIHSYTINLRTGQRVTDQGTREKRNEVEEIDDNENEDGNDDDDDEIEVLETDELLINANGKFNT